MFVRRWSAICFSLVLVLGALSGPVLANGDDCDEGDTWNEETGQCGETGGDDDSWVECREGRRYQVTQTENGTEEEDIGECDSWITDSWCEGDEQVDAWEDEAGEQWEERYPDHGCTDPGQSSWTVESWCEGDERVEERENESGERWQERHHDPECGDGRHHNDDHYDNLYEDPYGCKNGQWWDHYLARCVSEEAQRLLDEFWRCTEESHNHVAQKQRELDIQAREARQERRALEEEAMAHERAGRWKEADEIWQRLQRMDWEEQRRWHEMEQRMADAQAECIREYSAKAREIGADYLVEEFEMHRFHVSPEPMPHGGPGPFGGGAMECGPMNNGHDEARMRKDPYQDPYAEETYPTRAHRDEGFTEHREVDRHHGPGPTEDCPDGHRPGGEPFMEEGFGLPPEAQDRIREVRTWCEEQMWQIDSERYAAETFEEAQALEDRVRQVERECRQKMEAIFDEYSRGHDSGFEERFGSFTMTESGSDIEVIGKHLLFTGKPEQSRITDFSCQGTPVLDSVRPYFEIEDVWPTSEHKLAFFDHRVFDGQMPDRDRMSGHERSAFMVVHDDPHCTVVIKPSRAETQDAEVRIELPSLYECQRQDGHILCTDDEGTEILVRGHNEDPVLVDDRKLIVRSHVSIRLSSGVNDDQTLEEYSKHEKFDGSAAVSFKQGRVVAQAVTLGDLHMEVDESDDGRGVKVTLDKASHVGSFVVLTLDTAETCSVEIDGWAVDGDHRESLEMRKAGSLVDALDTEYDGDWVKYYTVQDAHGCQLIITNSHYSVKEFVVQQVEEGGLFNMVPAPGFVVAGVAIVGTAAIVRRRRA